MASAQPAETLPAVQRALANHLVLSNVLSWIDADKDYCWIDWYKSRESAIKKTEWRKLEPGADRYLCDHLRTSVSVLSQCMRVNKLWFEETARILWREAAFDSTHGYPHFTSSLTELLGDIQNDARRQFYANHMVYGFEKEFSKTRHQQRIERLEYPKLKKLKVMIWGARDLPAIDGSAVEHMIIDPHYMWDIELYSLDQRNTEAVLEKIIKHYPNLKQLEFADHAQAWPGSLERFRERMPRLSVFDHEKVRDTDEDRHAPVSSRQGDANMPTDSSAVDWDDDDDDGFDLFR